MKTILALKTGMSRAVGGFSKDCLTHLQKHYHDYPSDSKEDEYQKEVQVCDKCGGEFIPNWYTIVYDTPTGELTPGNLYWDDSLPENYYWDNHKGPHLMAICPGGGRWNIDSRASNCSMKDDRQHRCWVRQGTPGTDSFTVGKGGVTCKAGAGSILIDAGPYAPQMAYHGFLRNGMFTDDVGRARKGKQKVRVKPRHRK